MAIVSYVLESALGELPEGTVLQLDQEAGAKLVETGLAREASGDEVNGGGEDTPEEITESADVPVDPVESKSVDADEKIVKAAAKVAEKLIQSQVKRPYFGGQNLHVRGSDEGITGGFKSLGDFCNAKIQSDNGDYRASNRLHKAFQAMRTKTPMTISGSHVGSDLVPQQWAAELWALTFSKVPDLQAMCSQHQMANQIENIAAWVQSSAAAGVQANLTAENATIAETQGVTATVQLSLSKYAVIVSVSDELLRFNSYSLDSHLKRVAPERIRYLVNDSFINGGAGNQVNLISNAATVVVNRSQTGRINFDDVTRMEAALYTDFVDGAVWLVNNSTSPELYSLSFPNRSAATTFPAFTAGGFGNLLGPKPVGELLGKPVYRLENVPTLGSKGDLILYNPTSIVAGGTGLIGDSTPYLYFNKAVDTYRFLWYASTVNPMTVPYTRKDGSQAANIVVLGSGSSS